MTTTASPSPSNLILDDTPLSCLDSTESTRSNRTASAPFREPRRLSRTTSSSATTLALSPPVPVARPPRQLSPELNYPLPPVASSSLGINLLPIMRTIIGRVPIRSDPSTSGGTVDVNSGKERSAPASTFGFAAYATPVVNTSNNTTLNASEGSKGKGKATAEEEEDVYKTDANGGHPQPSSTPSGSAAITTRSISRVKNGGTPIVPRDFSQPLSSRGPSVDNDPPPPAFASASTSTRAQPIGSLLTSPATRTGSTSNPAPIGRTRSTVIDLTNLSPPTASSSRLQPPPPPPIPSSSSSRTTRVRIHDNSEGTTEEMENKRRKLDNVSRGLPNGVETGIACNDEKQSRGTKEEARTLAASKVEAAPAEIIEIEDDDDDDDDIIIVTPAFGSRSTTRAALTRRDSDVEVVEPVNAPNWGNRAPLNMAGPSRFITGVQLPPNGRRTPATHSAPLPRRILATPATHSTFTEAEKAAALAYRQNIPHPRLPAPLPPPRRQFGRAPAAAPVPVAAPSTFDRFRNAVGFGAAASGSSSSSTAAAAAARPSEQRVADRRMVERAMMLIMEQGDEYDDDYEFAEDSMGSDEEVYMAMAAERAHLARMMYGRGGEDGVGVQRAVAWRSAAERDAYNGVGGSNGLQGLFPDRAPPRTQGGPGKKYGIKTSHPRKVEVGFSRDIIADDDFDNDVELQLALLATAADLPTKSTSSKSKSKKKEKKKEKLEPVCASCLTPLLLDQSGERRLWSLRCGHVVCGKCMGEAKMRCEAHKEVERKARWSMNVDRNGSSSTTEEGKGEKEDDKSKGSKGKGKGSSVVSSGIESDWKGCPVMTCDSAGTDLLAEEGSNSGPFELFV